MKQILFTTIITCSIFLSGSCRKAADTQYPGSSGSVVGKWELRIAQTGMTAPVNYPSGNGNTLIFTATDYQVYSNGQLVKSGKYSNVVDNTALAGECLDVSLSRLIYDNNRSHSKRIQVSAGNRLRFFSGCSALDSGVFKEFARQ